MSCSFHSPPEPGRLASGCPGDGCWPGRASNGIPLSAAREEKKSHNNITLLSLELHTCTCIYMYLSVNLEVYSGCAFMSFPMSVIISKRKYTEGVAILSGKNVERVAVE